MLRASELFSGTAVTLLPSNRSGTLFVLSPGSGIVVFRNPHATGLRTLRGACAERSAARCHGAFRSTSEKFSQDSEGPKRCV